MLFLNEIRKQTDVITDWSKEFLASRRRAEKRQDKAHALLKEDVAHWQKERELKNRYLEQLFQGACYAGRRPSTLRTKGIYKPCISRAAPRHNP